MFLGEHVTEKNTDVEEMNNDQSDEKTEHGKGDTDMAKSYEVH